MKSFPSSHNSRLLISLGKARPLTNVGDPHDAKALKIAANPENMSHCPGGSCLSETGASNSANNAFTAGQFFFPGLAFLLILPLNAEKQTMQTQTILLPVAGAGSMNAYTVRPDGKGSFPAVMVFQEAFGVNHHIRSVTEKIAAQGYLAIAPELFHRTAPAGFEGSYSDFPSVMPHIQALTADGLSADVEAVYRWLQQQDDVSKNKIGCVGFCMGGRVSVLANAVLPLAASVSYYGGNMPSLLDKIKDLHAPQLLFWGGLDKHILPEHIDAVVRALKEAGKPYINVVISYADHAFNCDERPNYHPRAAKEAWGMTLAFLANNLQ